MITVGKYDIIQSKIGKRYLGISLIYHNVWEYLMYNLIQDLLKEMSPKTSLEHEKRHKVLKIASSQSFTALLHFTCVGAYNEIAIVIWN